MLRGQQVRDLGEPGRVVVALGVTGVTRGGVVSDAVVEVVHARSAHEVRVRGARPLDRELALRVLGLDEQPRGEDAVVTQRKKGVRVLQVVEDSEVAGGEVERVGLAAVHTHVGGDEVVLGRDVGGQLALDAVLVDGMDEGDRHRLRLARGNNRVLGIVQLLLAPGGEEPDTVPPQQPAERRLVALVELVDTRQPVGLLVGVPCRPVVVRERGAKRTVEEVAARLRDRVHDASGEAAVFGGDAAPQDRRLLNRVLDVEILGLAPQVLVDDGAVHEKQALEGLRSGDHEGRSRVGAADVPGRAVVGDTRGKQARWIAETGPAAADPRASACSSTRPATCRGACPPPRRPRPSRIPARARARARRPGGPRRRRSGSHPCPRPASPDARSARRSRREAGRAGSTRP